jgi:hypothetical protein
MRRLVTVLAVGVLLLVPTWALDEENFEVTHR